MNVTFAPFMTNVASARLRGTIPQRELAKLGIRKGFDILVIGKHGWEELDIRGFKKVVFDMCDDHFHDQHEAHYRKWCLKADLVTCNSIVMRDTIKRETGRDASIIDDPYEQPLREPKCSRPPMWFGHGSNFPDIFPYIDKLHDLILVSNIKHSRVIIWSPEVMDRMFDRAGIVLIPTGKKQAKSANRAVDSIRRGLYPCTGEMPAYTELWLGSKDILGEMESRLSAPEATKRRIKELQETVEKRFNPKTIGQQWLNALQTI